MMRASLAAGALLILAGIAACTGGLDTLPGVDAGPTDNAGCAATYAKYYDLADLQKYTFNRTCAFANNNCHFDEDPPPMHTTSMVWNMIGVPCNQGIPEYELWDPFCKAAADGGNDGVLVAPGNADDSYIMIRLLGDPRSTRTTMPFGAPSLSAEEIYVLRAWINGLVPSVSSPEDPIDYAKTACSL